MKRLALLLAATCAAPAFGQATGHNMAGMNMPGMAMPETATDAAAAAADPSCPPEHAAMGHCTPRPAPTAQAAPNQPPAVMPEAAAAVSDPDCPPEHAAAGHCTPRVAVSSGAAVGTGLPAGSAAPPAPPADRAADRFYPAATMAVANRAMRQAHGTMAFTQIMFSLAEYQFRRGRDGYRWDAEGWFGNDTHRLVIKSEGEGVARGGVEDAEVQALYARAIDPYFNLQAGFRQDLGAGAKRSYATIGVEGLAPYWFEVEAALFLSNKGDLLGRLEAYYDQRLTQRLILQPRVELNLAARNVAASRIGAGLSNAELGLRLRYEISRQFAPYVGLSLDRKTGDTARFARIDGEGATARSLVIGVRTWF